MAASESDIVAFLRNRGIEFQYYAHPPVYTCEEAAKYLRGVQGAAKNLFLRDSKGKRHFLVCLPENKLVDLKGLSPMLDADRLSFASPERLRKHLGLEPGSVTLLGVINDKEQRVSVFIDRDIWKEGVISCHPLVNTATLVIPVEGITRFFQAIKRAFELIDVPAREEA